jgi:hypothetical protein
LPSSNSPSTSIAAISAQLGFWIPTVGTSFEPALSAANMVQQVVTSPPFRFPWNRNSLTFTTGAGGPQDYTSTVADFGYGELATIKNPNAPVPKPLTLKLLNVTPIGESLDVQQPTTLCVLQNNVGTSVKFRFLGVPNAAYVTVVWYQKFAPLLTSLLTPWVMPDYMSYIYNRCLLAHLYEARGDARAQQEKVAFAAALLSTHEGLTDTEINIFLAQYLTNPRAMESLHFKTQQGIQARGQ